MFAPPHSNTENLPTPVLVAYTIFLKRLYCFELFELFRKIDCVLLYYVMVVYVTAPASASVQRRAYQRNALGEREF